LSDMISIDDRLAALEERVSVLNAENLALRSKVVDLESGGVRKRVPPPSEPSTTVHYQLPRASNFVAPTRAEAVALRTILGAQHPQLLNTDHLTTESNRGADRKYLQERAENAWFDQFELALRALSARLFVTDALDKKHAVGHFKDVCEGAVRRDIGTMPFLAAVLATHQIKYSELFVDGYSISLGLSEYVGREIRADGWKQTLATRKILAPVWYAPRKNDKEPTRPSVTVYGS
jgi:hypothetical protein